MLIRGSGVVVGAGCGGAQRSSPAGAPQDSYRERVTRSGVGFTDIGQRGRAVAVSSCRGWGRESVVVLDGLVGVIGLIAGLGGLRRGWTGAGVSTTVGLAGPRQPQAPIIGQ